MKKGYLFSLLLTIPVLVNAQIISVASGDWDDVMTWSGGNIPGIGDSVVINGHTVTLDISPIVEDLTILNGTLTGDESLTVTSTFVWEAGSIAGGGTMTVEGPSSLITSQKNLSKTLIMEGGVSWIAGTLNIHNNGVLRNAPGSTLTLNNAATMTITNSSGGTGNFQNQGTLTKSGAGQLTITAAVVFDNSGSVVINEGKIVCSNSNGGTHTGSFNIALNSFLELTAGNHTFDGVTSTGTGFIHIHVAGSATLTRGETHSTINRLQQSGGTITGTGSLDVNDQFLWQGGTISGAGMVTIVGQAELSTNSTKALTGMLILDSSTTWTEGSINIHTGGLMRNAVGSVFSIQNAMAMSLTNSSGGTGHFQNEGTLTKSGAGALSISALIDFTNPGSMMINEGNISLSNSGASTHTGSFTIAESSLLELTSGSHTFSGVTVTGSGFVHVISATLSRGATHSTINRLQQSGGTITGTGSLDVNDQFLWQGGTISGAGMVTIVGQAELSTNSTKALTGMLILDSSTTWTAGSINIHTGGLMRTAVGSVFSIQNAMAMSLTNSSGGTGHFQNEGTLTKSGAGALSISALIDFTNPGSVMINEGNISLSNSGASTHTGSFTIAESSLLELTSGSHTFNGVTVTGSGFVHVISATLSRGATHSTINRLQQSGGTIAGTGSMDVIDQFLWQAGTIAGTGIMTLEGQAVLSTGGTKTVTGTLILEGGGTWTDGAISIHNGGMMSNLLGSVFSIQNPATVSITNGSGGTGTFQNQGTLTKSDAGQLSITGLIVFDNSGSVAINEGKIVCTNSLGGTHTGSFNIALNSFFELNSNHTFNGVTSTGTGFIHVMSSGTLTRGAMLCTLNRLQQSGGTITGTGSINVIDQFLWQAGTIAGTGIMTIEGQAELSTGGTKTVTGTLILEGGGTWTDGAISIHNGGMMSNLLGSVFSIQNPATVSITNGSGGTGTFQNQGTLTKSDAGQLSITGLIVFDNSGSVAINEGKIVCTNSLGGTHTGSFNITLNSFFELNSNHTFNGATSTGTGFIHVMSSGTLTRGAMLCTLSRLQQSGGTISGTGSINVIDQFLWQAGTIAGTGIMTLEGQAELSTGGVKTLTGMLILEGGGTWTEGTISLHSGGMVSNALGSAFFIQNAATISMSNGSGGTGTFLNQGTLTKSGAGQLSISGVIVFDNQGTIYGIGTISNSSTFTNTGIIAPGLSPGIITMNGAQPFSASSTLQIEIQDGTGAGTGHDQLTRAGNLTLEGTITVTETGVVPDALYTIIHLTSGTISGTFTTINLPPGYVLHQLATQVIVAKNTPLPLTLLSFTAGKTSEEHVLLQWTTTDEEAVSHFEIQRSTNLVDYMPIAIVEAMNRPGDHQYYFTDDRPSPATNYYRLKIVDLDGQSRFSPIRDVQFKGKDGFKAYPTMTTDKIFIETNEVTMVRLFSSTGMLLQSLHSTGFTQMDLSHLPPDIYVLFAETNGKSLKIMKY